MILKHNKANLLTIGVSDGVTVRLMPGVNTIADETWLKLKDNPIVKMKLKAKSLEVIEDAKEGKKSAKKAEGEHDGEVTDTNPSTEDGEISVELVAEMFDMLKLKELSKHKNKAIKKAAKDRLKELNQPEIDAGIEKDDE